VADAMSVEILGTVVGVLGGIALITWRFWPWVEQTQREQREDPFGSKRWHLPAVAFLGLLVIVSIILLRFVEDPR
jgi:TRAP-type mannitol/chloroaromatic compound transport system permease small subunit